MLLFVTRWAVRSVCILVSADLHCLPITTEGKGGTLGKFRNLCWKMKNEEDHEKRVSGAVFTVAVLKLLRENCCYVGVLEGARNGSGSNTWNNM